MARKHKKTPPRVYHDGLIPATTDTHQSYPEVVPDDHDQVKHEKSYPELAPPPPQEQPASSPPPPTSTGTSPTAQTAHQQSLPGGLATSPLAAPPLIHAAPPLPRTSGVHSLRQAWSEVDETEEVAPLKERPPFWKRSVFWVAVIALVIIVVLAGVLGGVASGKITSASGSSSNINSNQQTSSVTDPACPAANNLNYTSASSTPQKVFRIQCDADYPGGDGLLGLLNTTTVDDMAGCLDACANQAECVGAVFRPGTPGQCWLKQFIGVVKTGGDASGTVAAILWQ